MNLKSVFQIILLFTIFTISGIFYYKFFATKDKKVELITENEEQLSSKLEDKIESELINIEYNSSDSEGNTFYINAERAMVSKKDTKNNNINLEGVISIVNLKNKGIINIYSKNALYNKQNKQPSEYINRS